MFVQGDKYTPLFSYNLHKRELTLEVYICLAVPLSSIPLLSLCLLGSHWFCSYEGTSKGMEGRGRGADSKFQWSIIEQEM